jgi:hypothetical protein
MVLGFMFLLYIRKVFISNFIYTMPQLRRFVAGFPPRRLEFEPRSFHVGFVVDKMELG